MDTTGRELAAMEHRATEFLRDSLERYAAYRDHKETMAYAGFTLYAGAIVAGLMAKEWPPAWRVAGISVGVALVVALWSFVLTFLKWQLHRRRWAALRVAGMERLLAEWISKPPTSVDLQVSETAIPNPGLAARFRGWIRTRLVLLGDLLWPLRGAVIVCKPEERVYPTRLVEVWCEQARRGSEAIQHERLLTIAGWLLFGLLMVRTLPRGAV